MFSSLRFRLWLTYILVVGVVLTIAGLAVAVFLLRNPAQDRREVQRLRLVSNLVAQRRQLFDLESLLENPRLQDLASRADNLTGTRIVIFSAAGELLADSRRASAPPLPEWSYFAAREPDAGSVFRDGANRQWLYARAPLEDGSVLLAAIPRPRAQFWGVLRDEFLSPFVRGALLALGLTVLLSIWIANWIAAPLQRLEKATREVSGEAIGETFAKVRLEGPREVQAVARSFNEMAERVLASQRSQRDFIANISHDLKTPLTSIQGFAQAILDGTANDPASARQSAEVIFDEAGRMHRMVMELLDLARMEAGTQGFERLPIDLESLLNRVVEKFTPQASQAQVELRLDFALQEEGSSAVLADDDRLSQVFSNLIDNALKYTPPGGLVTVVAHLVDGWAEVQVADTGPGIPSGELERIFERFYQTDKARAGGARRGLGLGLAIAREIVQAHGGAITAYNRSQLSLSSRTAGSSLTAGSGSVFVVRLPLARPGDGTLARKRKGMPLRVTTEA